MFQNVLKFVLMFSWVGVIPSGVPPSSDRRHLEQIQTISRQFRAKPLLPPSVPHVPVELADSMSGVPYPACHCAHQMELVALDSHLGHSPDLPGVLALQVLVAGSHLGHSPDLAGLLALEVLVVGSHLGHGSADPVGVLSWLPSNWRLLPLIPTLAIHLTLLGCLHCRCLLLVATLAIHLTLL